jgi:LysM repeat protein
MLALAACAQPASVGIPTPSQATRDAQQQQLAPTATVSQVTDTPIPPLPTDTAMPQSAATETPTPVSSTAVPAAVTPEDTTPEPTPVPSTGSVSCNRLITYIVKPGDNLFRIALRYRTTILAIARRNGLTNTRVIHVGQRLRILTCAGGSAPDDTANGSYVVQPGDNLFRIALRYGTTAEHLKAINGLSSNLIAPGLVLLVP